MSEEQERLREREELIHALRNFAEHFGAAEVYQQARAIYLESPAGREQEASASFASILRESSQSPSERPKRTTPGRRSSGGTSPLADAKKALGG